eukprot:755372_1
MALIADIYSDSDDDTTMDKTDNQKSKETPKPSSRPSKPLPKPLPPRRISWDKKRSFSSYSSCCRNDNRGNMVSNDPNSENYITQTMPIKNRKKHPNHHLDHQNHYQN